MLYRILLFSVKPQHESATVIHISDPFWTSLPSPSPSHLSRLIQSPCLSFLRHTANSCWLSIYIGNVNFHVTLNIHLTLSSPLTISISLFSMSVSPFLSCQVKIFNEKEINILSYISHCYFGLYWCYYTNILAIYYYFFVYMIKG